MQRPHGGRTPALERSPRRTGAEKTWRQRLARLRSYPSKKAVAQFLDEVVRPALSDVAEEFRAQGYTAHFTTTTGTETGVPEHTLVIDMADHRDFHYQAAATEAPMPALGSRPMSRGDDVYYRVEVFTQTGTEGYDLMGLTRQQVINDVLDRYETHLSFLAYSHERDYASVLTPVVPPEPSPTPAIPPAADNVEPIED